MSVLAAILLIYLCIGIALCTLVFLLFGPDELYGILVSRTTRDKPWMLLRLALYITFCWAHMAWQLLRVK